MIPNRGKHDFSTPPRSTQERNFGIMLRWWPAACRIVRGLKRTVRIVTHKMGGT
jgi:hypothetical protein